MLARGGRFGRLFNNFFKVANPETVTHGRPFWVHIEMSF